MPPKTFKSSHQVWSLQDADSGCPMESGCQGCGHGVAPQMQGKPEPIPGPGSSLWAGSRAWRTKPGPRPAPAAPQGSALVKSHGPKHSPSWFLGLLNEGTGLDDSANLFYILNVTVTSSEFLSFKFIKTKTKTKTLGIRDLSQQMISFLSLTLIPCHPPPPSSLPALLLSCFSSGMAPVFCSL